MADKLCPIKFLMPKDAPPSMGYECEEEKCAWWDRFYKQCAMVSISTDICKLEFPTTDK